MECLITGIKGFGKTAHALDLVFLQDSEFRAYVEKNPETGENISKPMNVYVEGIQFTEAGNLACPHFDFPFLSDLKKPDYVPLSTVDDDGEEADKYKPWLKSSPDYADFLEVRATAKHSIELWFMWAQKGSVIFLDEAQRFYRPRPSGAKVPLHIRMIEYARHYGIHFVFISQAPRFIDINLRAHVEKHIHLDKTWRGGQKFESVGCMDIDSKADRKDCAKTTYKPPKHVFPLYVSSALHLKIKHKIPFAVKVFFAAIPLFIFIVWFAVSKIMNDHGVVSIGATAVPHVTEQGLVMPVAVLSLGVASGVPASLGLAEVETFLKRFSAVVPGRPETAHAYDDLRHVVNVPRVASCVQSSKSCVCYSQQASRLRDITPERCAQILENGHEFDPYLVEPAPSLVPSPVLERATSL